MRARSLFNPVRESASAPPARGYNAFISYTHDDEKLAAALQDGIEKYAKPWNRVRALRVFRDEASLAATSELWSAIIAAMSQATWFVLIASREAADSEWVNREAEWWVANKSVSKMFIILADGTISWDRDSGDFDWKCTSALPQSLRRAFLQEPLWVPATWARSPQQVSSANPSLQDVTVTIAAAVRGCGKDVLVEEADREHRKTMRLARGAVTGLAALLALAVAAAAVATVQRNDAIHLAQVAISRQLASASGSELATNLDSALLLAVQAYRTNPNAQTLGALMQADTSSPYLVRYVSTHSNVTQLAGSGDGTTIVAGLATGQVLRWRIGHAPPQAIFRLRAAASSLAVSREGSVVAASDGSSARLWRAGRPLVTLVAPAGQKADSVGLSPSGRTAVVHGAASTGGTADSITIFNVQQLRVAAVHADPLSGSNFIAVPSDSEAVLFDTYNDWEWRTIPGWTTQQRGGAGLGVTELAALPSENGLFFTHSNGTSPIPVWRTDSRGGVNHNGYSAQIPAGLLTSPSALALSPDGRTLAVAGSSAMYVTPVTPTAAPQAKAIQLTGISSITSLSFLGNKDWLLSASGSQIALWNLHQANRVAREISTKVRLSCDACAGPDVVISPDGKLAAIVDGDGADATIQPLPGTRGQQQSAPQDTFNYIYDQPVWDGNRQLALPVSPPIGGSNVSPPLGVQPTLRVWAAGDGTDPVLAAAMTRSGNDVITVDTLGRIYLQDTRTGKVLRVMRSPVRLTTAGDTLQGAAVDPSADLVATVADGAARLITPFGSRATERIPGRNAVRAAFAGHKLLVQLSSGDLEVWNDQASILEQIIPGNPSYGAVAGNPQGNLVARLRSDGSIQLDDLGTGAVLDTLPAFSTARQAREGLAFTPDGQHLIVVISGTGPDISSAVLIDLAFSPANLVHAACAAAGRALTRPEWRSFVGTTPPTDLACQ